MSAAVSDVQGPRFEVVTRGDRLGIVDHEDRTFADFSSAAKISTGDTQLVRETCDDFNAARVRPTIFVWRRDVLPLSVEEAAEAGRFDMYAPPRPAELLRRLGEQGVV